MLSYENAEIALNTGMMLHEMLQHESLAKVLLYSDECVFNSHSHSLYRFPYYIETTSFSVSCDAFGNLHEVLTRHREMAAEFLERHYERFFTMYASLLDSPNYVTRRQSLKLLGELLVNRSNYAVMIRFVADEENLKRAMNALRDKSKNIQFEAFHVFKVRCVGTC